MYGSIPSGRVDPLYLRIFFPVKVLTSPIPRLSPAKPSVDADAPPISGASAGGAAPDALLEEVPAPSASIRSAGRTPDVGSLCAGTRTSSGCPRGAFLTPLPRPNIVDACLHSSGMYVWDTFHRGLPSRQAAHFQSRLTVGETLTSESSGCS